MVQSNTEPARIVFKKYGKNRRLYDTSSKRYVTLEELAAAVRRGAAVQVVDAETGEDLTRICLTQIIMEDSKDKTTGLPIELLRQLVITSDHVGREFIMWYLKSAFEAYRKVQNALEDGLSEVRSAASSPLQLMKNFIQSRTPEKQPQETELQELRKRIAELEERLQHSQAPQPHNRRSKKAPSKLGKSKVPAASRNGR
jgi:polyhydroxyalkanoate synthesis repressor PhaR